MILIKIYNHKIGSIMFQQLFHIFNRLRLINIFKIQKFKIPNSILVYLNHILRKVINYMHLQLRKMIKLVQITIFKFNNLKKI